MNKEEKYFLEVNKKEILESLKKLSSMASTQPTYVDESGKVFTATDIVTGYKPKGKYKGSSASRIGFITEKAPKKVRR